MEIRARSFTFIKKKAEKEIYFGQSCQANFDVTVNANTNKGKRKMFTIVASKKEEMLRDESR